MSNGNTPAFPVIEESKSEQYNGATHMTGTAVSLGLTKREYIAALLLQGVLAQGGYPDDYAVSKAVRVTDELLAELEKSK